MSDDRFDHLPVVIAEIAEVAGIDVAWKIAQSQGGRMVYIPTKANDAHWLVQLVGRVAADKICEYYAISNSGIRILIPLGRQSEQRQRLSAALESGLSAPQAASMAGVHVRTAYRARRRVRQSDKSQTDLFKSPSD